jgi:hypothetical protein
MSEADGITAQTCAKKKRGRPRDKDSIRSLGSNPARMNVCALGNAARRHLLGLNETIPNCGSVFFQAHMGVEIQFQRDVFRAADIYAARAPRDGGRLYRGRYDSARCGGSPCRLYRGRQTRAVMSTVMGAVAAMELPALNSTP